MNENNKQAPTLQVLDSGGRYASSFVQMDDAVARFGQVVPNSPVAAMENLNRLPPGQPQGQCWPPYPYTHDPNNRPVGGYDHYRSYPGFAGQFSESPDQYSGNHAGFSMRYQEVTSKPEHVMSGNHLLCLDDGLGYPISETRAASLPPFSSITTQSLPPRPQSAVKEDIRGYDEGLGARLTGSSTPSHSEFGEGLSARLLERGMGVHSREDNYTPPVQYRPWEPTSGPVRVSSRSQSETSQTPPSSASGYPEKRDEEGDSRSPWYRAKSESSSFSKEPNLVSLDKPSDHNSGTQKGGSSLTPVDNQSDSSNTYSPLTNKHGHHQAYQHGREESPDMGRLPFPSNSFGYFPGSLPPPLLGSGVGPPWDYRNDIPLKSPAGEGAIDPSAKYPLVPPPVRPGEMQNIQHQYMDDRQLRGGRQHGGGSYCQNGSDSYKYPPISEAQSPGMQPTPPNAQNYSGSGNMHMKSEHEPGLKGGDKLGSHASSTTPSANLKPGEMGRGTKNAASASDDSNEKKPKKQKRKRCGECLGCQRKDNCGDCAPCRNEKSHQICKMRRCEKLIERKCSSTIILLKEQSSPNEKIAIDMNQPYLINGGEDISQLMEFSKDGFWNNGFYDGSRCEVVPSSEHEFECFDAENEVRTYTDLEPIDKGLNKHQLTNDRLKKKLKQRQDAKAAKNIQESTQIKTSQSFCQNSNQGSVESNLTLPSYSSLEHDFSFSLSKNEKHEYPFYSDPHSNAQTDSNHVTDFSVISFHHEQQLPNTQNKIDHSLFSTECKNHLTESSLTTLPNSVKTVNTFSPASVNQRESNCQSQNLNYTGETSHVPHEQKSSKLLKTGEIKTDCDSIKQSEINQVTSLTYDSKENHHHFNSDRYQYSKANTHNKLSNNYVCTSSENTFHNISTERHLMNPSHQTPSTLQTIPQCEKQKHSTLNSNQKQMVQNLKIPISLPTDTSKIFQDNSHLTFGVDSQDSLPFYNEGNSKSITEIIVTSQNFNNYNNTPSNVSNFSSILNVQTHPKETISKSYCNTKPSNSSQYNKNLGIPNLSLHNFDSKNAISSTNDQLHYSISTVEMKASSNNSTFACVLSSRETFNKTQIITTNYNQSNAIVSPSLQTSTASLSLSSVALTTVTTALPNSPLPSLTPSITSLSVKNVHALKNPLHSKINYQAPVTLPLLPSNTVQQNLKEIIQNNDIDNSNKDSNNPLPITKEQEGLDAYLKVSATEDSYREDKPNDIDVSLLLSNASSLANSHNTKPMSPTHSQLSSIVNKGKNNLSSQFCSFANDLQTSSFSLPDPKPRFQDSPIVNGISLNSLESKQPKTRYFDTLTQGLVYSTATRASSKLLTCKSQFSSNGNNHSANESAPLMSSTPFMLHPKKSSKESSFESNVLKTHLNEASENQKTTENLNNCPILERLERLRTNTKIEAPSCDCLPKDDMVYQERTPYYTHLGSGPTLIAVREIMEKRFEVKGEAIRIEKLRYTGKEGKTAQGCPIAKWIIRRANAIEKYLVLIKHRFGHHCDTAWIVIAIVAWEGVPSDAADDLYDTLVYKLTNFGLATQRRCGINEQRTCACQGMDNQSGASFSFGCSWSMYYNGCKFARSKNIRKFKLGESTEETEVEEKLQNLATDLAPVYKQIAPESFSNQVEFEDLGRECRLGRKAGRPWSGVTACVDFCAHAHKDLHNMNNGCTVVVTLTKHRGLEKPEDEQLHVLPLYIMEDTDEYNSKENQMRKIRNGSLEVLRSYPMEMRFRKNPLSPCRRRGRKRKDDANVTPKKKQNALNSFYNNSINESGDKSPHGDKGPIATNLHVPKASESPGKKNYNSFKRPLFGPKQVKCPSNIPNPSLHMDSKTFNECLQKTFEELKAKRIINNKFQMLMEESLQTLKQNIPANDKYLRENIELNNLSPVFTNKINKKSLKTFMSSSFDERQGVNLENLQQPTSKLLPHPNNVFPSALHLLSEAVSMKCQELVDSSVNEPKTYNKQDIMHTDLSSSQKEYRRQDHHSANSVLTPSTVCQTVKWMSNSNQCSNGNLSPCKMSETNVHASQVPFRQSWSKVSNKDLSVASLNNGNFSSRSFMMQKLNNSTHSETFSKESSPLQNKSVSFDMMPEVHLQTQQSFSSNFSSQDSIPKNNNISSEKKSITSSFPKSANEMFAFMKEGQVMNTQEHNQQQLPPFSNFFQQPCPSFQNGVSSRNTVYPLPVNNIQNSKQSQESKLKLPASLNSSNYLTSTLPTLDEIRLSQVSHSKGNLTEHQKLLQTKDCNITKHNPKPNFLSQYAPFLKADNQWNPLLRPNVPYTKEEKLEPEMECTTPPPSPPLTDEEKDPNGYFEIHSDNEENFMDNTIGGVAIALSHRSVLFECAKHELHATTALKRPNRLQPTRISLVFYQHKNLNLRYHGLYEWEKKMEMKRLEETVFSEGPSPCKKPKQGTSNVVNVQVPTRQTITTATTSWITVFPFPPVVVTGPYQKWI